MLIHCKYDELVDSMHLNPHPKNRNKHPKDQIERLANILKYQGLRAPIVVSKQSGFIVKGHGTLQAIKSCGEEKAPIVYQDFESEEQEYAFVQSDNAIASWAELDFSGINVDLENLGPDFDIDLLGIRSFLLEPADKFIAEEHWTEDYQPQDAQFKIICIIDDESKKEEFLKLINCRTVKKFKNGNMWSLHFPQND